MLSLNCAVKNNAAPRVEGMASKKRLFLQNVISVKTYSHYAMRWHKMSTTRKIFIHRLKNTRFYFILVYVEWEPSVNFVTILVTYIKINFGVYVRPSCSASGQNDDVIKMAAIVLRMHIYK